MTASFDEGRACLLSFGRGEFDGWTNVYDADQEPYHLPGTQALRFVYVGGELLVVHGLQHGFGSGRITRLQRRSDGRLTQSIIANLHDYPLAFAIDDNRSLLLIRRRLRIDIDDCQDVILQLDRRHRLSVVQ